MASMSSHAQNDFVSREFLAAANALSLTALNDMPGGSISPFCATPTVTSTLHSSWRESGEGGEGKKGIHNKTGWPAFGLRLRDTPFRGQRGGAGFVWRGGARLCL